MCEFRTHPGRGPFQFICVPGLVPDGPETFLRQLPLLRRFGAVTVMTYPYDHFDLDQVLTALRLTIEQVRAEGRLPVLMGVSVGAGICLELLRRARSAEQTIDLAAFILISPFTCTSDLAPLLARLVSSIEQESDRGDQGQPGQVLERGRALFRSLASRSVAAKPVQSGWRAFFAMLTPQGFAERGEARIRARIEATLEAIPAQGGLARVLALRQMSGLDTDARATKPLTQAPTLILWGSKERHTLTMDGPGTRVLSRPDLASRHFPNLEVQWIYTNEGEEVPHASLLKHAAPFNRHLRHFMRRRCHAFGGLNRMALMARAATPMALFPEFLRGT
ncbi:MAG TPA: alpha/beta hydrolase [Planctomycetota bacterium]|nr:alpha/beta hydrolase [Planctomycetota bacterium]